MTTIAQQTREITGGVDAHKDTHTAAAVDSAGRPLGAESPGESTRQLRARIHRADSMMIASVSSAGVTGRRARGVRRSAQLFHVCSGRAPAGKVLGSALGPGVRVPGAPSEP